MENSLANLATKIQEIKQEIKNLVEFKLLVKNKNNYVALIESRNENKLWDRDLIVRYHTLEEEFRSPILKLIEKQIKIENEKILECEKQIKQGTIASIMEDSQTPDKEKLNFFEKLFKT